jgi:ethanolamine ammonia-lyase large subunit
VAQLLGASLVIYLIGERPGGDAWSSRSMSAYLVYLPREAGQPAANSAGDGAWPQFEYTVISNIYSRGLPGLEASAVIVEKSLQILEHHAAGNRLEALLRASTGVA